MCIPVLMKMMAIMLEDLQHMPTALHTISFYFVKALT